jgi:hypothetical protein
MTFPDPVVLTLLDKVQRLIIMRVEICLPLPGLSREQDGHDHMDVIQHTTQSAPRSRLIVVADSTELPEGHAAPPPFRGVPPATARLGR